MDTARLKERVSVALHAPMTVEVGGVRINSIRLLTARLVDRSAVLGLAAGLIASYVASTSEFKPVAHVVAIVGLAFYLLSDALVGLTRFSAPATDTSTLEELRGRVRGFFLGATVTVTGYIVLAAELSDRWKVAAIMAGGALALRTRGDDLLTQKAAADGAAEHRLEQAPADEGLQAKADQTAGELSRAAAALVQSRVWATILLAAAILALSWPDHWSLEAGALMILATFALVLTVGGVANHAVDQQRDNLLKAKCPSPSAPTPASTR